MYQSAWNEWVSHSLVNVNLGEMNGRYEGNGSDSNRDRSGDKWEGFQRLLRKEIKPSANGNRREGNSSRIVQEPFGDGLWCGSSSYC